MTKQYIPNAFLKVENSQVYAVFQASPRPPELIANKSWLIVLEIFVHQHDIESAYNIFEKLKLSPIITQVTPKLQPYQSLISEQTLVVLSAANLAILKKGFNSFFDEKETFQIAMLSQGNYQVLAQLFLPFSLKNDLEEINSLDDFRKLVINLEKIGLLSVANNSLNWGDLKRTNPMCQFYGYLRGEPIDKYYVNKFIEKIKPEIVGNILEIGAGPQAKETYELSDDCSYRNLNIKALPEVDIVGDVHDVNLVEPESCDTILLFNVLEHCYAPWIVIENIYTWLKPGGKCFAATPVGVRIHADPTDYWRPLPNAFTWMLRNFSKHEIYSYGNAMSVTASLYGISHQELTIEELDAYHPDYPVTVCIEATK
ncbi:methyltransferase domain-containing protein [Phormidium sp. LEGE 05292]|uniref:class I SAM-dependent methyltransferase n=1 Tax=[Phormidium] sp. LEGE 05292 TaxID=767427 RepID=UPI00187F04B9|nr:methyltransferase domain-containing protein [Phormidium sp. LEGE 05292]MBE9229908.1 methyltransferase domain-containing protein [Phormidium sp. LEGE 05292]